MAERSLASFPNHTSFALLPQLPACPLSWPSNCLPAVAEGKNAINYVAFMDALRTGLITYVPVNRQAVKQSAGNCFSCNCLVLPSGGCARQVSMLFMVSNLQQHGIEHVLMLLEVGPTCEGMKAAQCHQTVG